MLVLDVIVCGGCGHIQALSAVSAQIQKDSQVSSFLKQEISSVRWTDSCIVELLVMCWVDTGGAEC